MRKTHIFYIFIICIFTGCSQSKERSINLSKDCKINYTIEDDKVINLELIQAKNSIIVYFPEQNEIQFCIDNSSKNCSAIISEDFYSLGILNGEDNSFSINMNTSNISLDLRAKENFRSVIQYNFEHKEADHYEQIEGEEHIFKITKEGFSK